MNQRQEIEGKSAIDMLLEEQRSLLPIFSLSTEIEKRRLQKSELQGAFRNQIPLSSPLPGEQYAFEVDLDRCSGCKSCVTACHSLNGLDSGETWRSVGQLVGDFPTPFLQAVTTACHHCLEPACLKGCPVDAYHKDPRTGIVLHLDDQCIGCQYCILKCPYDVPKYSERRGIVRKCDMCHSRMSAGEAPACVNACPPQAIRIISVPGVAREGPNGESDFLPSSPNPCYTFPTTRYKTSKPFPENVQAADFHIARPQPYHWPLALMLVFTQAGSGGALAWIAQTSGSLADGKGLGFASWSLFHFGLVASVAHLGSPRKAWRFFLGLRHSWLSREILCFGWASIILTAMLGLPAADRWLLSTGSAACILGIFCSAMVYHDTQRTSWKLPYTFAKFTLTTLISGLILHTAFLQPSTLFQSTLIAIVSALIIKTAVERLSRCSKQASLLSSHKPFRILNASRHAMLGIFACSLFYLQWPIMTWTAFIIFLIGELCERALFFGIVDAPKMPGEAHL